MNKRTSGSATLAGSNSYSGGTFIDDPDGTLSGPVPTQPPTLYWALGGSGTWDTLSTDNDWSSNANGGGTLVPWSNGDIADFAAATGGTTIIKIDGQDQISPAGIVFGSAGYALDDDGGNPSQLLIPSSGMVVTVAAGVQVTIGCQINDGSSLGETTLTKEGLGTVLLSGANGYTGGTFIDAGIVQAGSGSALGAGELTVDETGVFDLNGNNITVSSLSSAGLQSGTITDNSIPTGIPTVLSVVVVNNPGVFGGVIEDGDQKTKVGLDVEINGQAEGLLLTRTGQNTYTGGSAFNGGLQIGDGTHNGSITGDVDIGPSPYFRMLYAYAADGIVFDVAAGTTETFNGTLADNVLDVGGFLLKTGAGTLVLNGVNDAYSGATGVEGGTLQLGADTALTGTNLTIDGGNLDLGDHHAVAASMMLINGNIWQNGPNGQGTAESGGQLTSGVFIVENGDVTANLGGPGGLTENLAGDSVVLAGCDTYAGLTYVAAGTLTVNGIVGTAPSSVSVASGANLGGTGTLSGSVAVHPGGALSLGSATGGGPLTMGDLTLESGSVVNDEIGSADTYLAQITGTLTIQDTVTLSFAKDTVYVPYHVLFHYGSFAGSLANLSYTLPPNASLLNDSMSIYLTLKPMLYWTAAGNATLGGSAICYASSALWWDPTTSSAVQWQSGDIAVFEGTGAVTLGTGFVADPAGMLFLGSDYTFAGPGKFSLPSVGSITSAAAINVSISAEVDGGAAFGDAARREARPHGNQLLLQHDHRRRYVVDQLRPRLGSCARDSDYQHHIRRRRHFAVGGGL